MRPISVLIASQEVRMKATSIGHSGATKEDDLIFGKPEGRNPRSGTNRLSYPFMNRHAGLFFSLSLTRLVHTNGSESPSELTFVLEKRNS